MEVLRRKYAGFRAHRPLWKDLGFDREDLKDAFEHFYTRDLQRGLGFFFYSMRKVFSSNTVNGIFTVSQRK